MVIRRRQRPESDRPGRVVERIQQEVTRVLSELLPGKSSGTAGLFPAANISEDDENLFVRAEIPGIGPEEIEVLVEEDSVTVRGERKVDAAETMNFHRREREGGNFRRILTLPSRIDPEKAVASFKDGILKIVLPRVGATEPRQVEVKAE